MSSDGRIEKQLSGDIQLNNVHFSYPARLDTKVLLMHTVLYDYINNHEIANSVVLSCYTYIHAFIIITLPYMDNIVFLEYD